MKKIILLLVLNCLLVSCLGSKSVSEKTVETKITDIEKSTKDSLSAATINQAIKDAIKMYIPKSETNDKDFDEAVDNAVDKILSNLNQQKNSGNNGYTINYDRIKRELLLELNVGETKDTETAVKETKETNKTFEQQSDEYFSKKVSSIPWWVWFVAVIYFLPSFINSITLLINPIQKLIKK